MANGRLLDTNVVIRVMKNEIPMPEWAWYDENVFVSIVTLGELLLGAELSQKKMENKNAYINFCKKFKILTIDFEVACEYAKIKSALRKQGTPIPENDMWLAATALAFDLIMVTGDKHFSSIPNLQVEQM